MPKINANGTNLYYELHGAGQPLLFIHGLGSSTLDWANQVPEFSGRYQVITFDLRGHGRSDKPAGPYRMGMFAADTVALLRTLGVQQAHVVGLSLGGGIGFQLAVDAPSVVKTLVVVNSGPELMIQTFGDRLAVWQRVAIVRLMGMREMGKVLSKRLLVEPGQQAQRDDFTARWAKNDPRAYLAAFRAMLNWSVTDRLGTIACPTLVITADHDYSPVAVKQAYTAMIPNAQLAVIPDSRHATPVERPQQFNQVLQTFLSNHP